jgi:hypothetical protein
VNDLYDTDLVLWTERQADALRRRAANEIDWDNVAKEIENLGRSDQRDLASCVQIVLDHLIRLRASPATEPRRSWKRTLIVRRDGIHKLLDKSPSLRPLIAGIIAAELPMAQRLALLALAEHGKKPTIDVATLNISEDELLQEDLSP